MILECKKFILAVPAQQILLTLSSDFPILHILTESALLVVHYRTILYNMTMADATVDR